MDDCFKFDELGSDCVVPKDIGEYNFANFGNIIDIKIFTDLKSIQVFNFASAKENSTLFLNGFDIFNHMGDQRNKIRTFTISINDSYNIARLVPNFINLKFSENGTLPFDIEDSSGTTFISADQCDKINTEQHEVPIEFRMCLLKSSEILISDDKNAIILNDCTKYEYSYTLECFEIDNMASSKFDGFKDNFTIFVGADITNAVFINFSSIDASSFDICSVDEEFPYSIELIPRNVKKHIITIDLDSNLNDRLFDSIGFYYLNLVFIGENNSLIPSDSVEMIGVHINSEECIKNILSKEGQNFMIEHSSGNALKCFGIPKLLNTKYQALIISSFCDDYYYSAIDSKCVDPNDIDADIFDDFSDAVDTYKIVLNTSVNIPINLSKLPTTNLQSLIIENPEIDHNIIKNLISFSIYYDSMDHFPQNIDLTFKYIDVTFDTQQTGEIEWIFNGSLTLIYSKIHINNGNFTSHDNLSIRGNYKSNYELFDVGYPEVNDYKYIYVSYNDCNDISDDLEICCVSPENIDQVNISEHQSAITILVKDSVPKFHVLEIGLPNEVEIDILGISNGNKPNIYINSDSDSVYRFSSSIFVRDVNLIWITPSEKDKIVPFSYLYFYDSTLSGSSGYLRILKNARFISKPNDLYNFFTSPKAKFTEVIVSNNCDDILLSSSLICLSPDYVQKFKMSSINPATGVFTVTLQTSLTSSQLFNFGGFPSNVFLFIRKDPKLIEPSLVKFTFRIASNNFKKLYFQNIQLSFDTSMQKTLSCTQLVFEDVEADNINDIFYYNLFETNNPYKKIGKSAFAILIISDNCVKESTNMRCVLPKDAYKFDSSELVEDSLPITIRLKTNLTYDQQIDFSRMKAPKQMIIASDDKNSRKFTFQIPKIVYNTISFGSIDLRFDTKRTKSFEFRECILTDVTINNDDCNLVSVSKRECITVYNTELPTKCFTTPSTDPKYSSFEINDFCLDLISDVKCLALYDIVNFDVDYIDPATKTLSFQINTDVNSNYLLDMSHFTENISISFLSKPSEEKTYEFLFNIPNIRFNTITFTNIVLLYENNPFYILKCNELIFANVSMDIKYCNCVLAQYNKFTSDPTTYPTDCFNNEMSNKKINYILISNNCPTMNYSEICMSANDITNFNLEKLDAEHDVFTIELEQNLGNSNLFNFNLFPRGKTLVVKSNEETISKYPNFFFQIPKINFHNITFKSFKLYFNTAFTKEIVSESMTFDSIQMNTALCDSIKMTGNSFVSTGGNVDSICFGMNDEDRPTPEYGLINAIYIQNDCKLIDYFDNSACFQPNKVDTIDFAPLDPHKVIKIICNDVPESPIAFTNLKEMSSVEIIANSPTSPIPISIPKVKFDVFTIHNCELSINLQLNDVLKFNKLVLDKVTISSDVCGGILFLPNTIIEGGGNNCFVSVNDKYPDTQAVLIINSLSCIDLPNVKCISAGDVYEYDFSYIDCYKDTLLIEVQNDIIDYFDFRTLKYPIDVVVNGITNRHFNLNTFRMGSTIGTFSFMNLELNFLIAIKNQIKCNKLVIRDSASVEASNSKGLDLYNVNELDFDNPAYYTSTYFNLNKIFYSATYVDKHDKNDIQITEERINFGGLKIDFPASHIIIAANNDITITVQALNPKDLIVKAQKDMSITVNRGKTSLSNFVFGIEPNGFKTTLNYNSKQVPISLSGKGQLVLNIEQGGDIIEITENVTSRDLEIISTAKNTKTILINKLLFDGAKPTIKAPMTLEANKVVVKDYQLPVIEEIMILDSLEIGSFSNLSGRIIFGSSAEFVVSCHKKMAMPLLIDNVVSLPRTVKLVKSTTITSGGGDWPLNIPFFAAKSSANIGLIDEIGKYELKVVDGILCAVVKAESQGGTEKNGLGTGEIAGIVVGVIIAVVFVVVLFFCCKTKKVQDLVPSHDEEEEEEDNIELKDVQVGSLFCQSNNSKPGSTVSYEIESDDEYTNDFYL